MLNVTKYGIEFRIQIFEPIKTGTIPIFCAVNQIHRQFAAWVKHIALHMYYKTVNAFILTHKVEFNYNV